MVVSERAMFPRLIYTKSSTPVSMVSNGHDHVTMVEDEKACVNQTIAQRLLTTSFENVFQLTEVGLNRAFILCCVGSVLVADETFLFVNHKCTDDRDSSRLSNGEYVKFAIVIQANTSSYCSSDCVCM